MPVYRFIKKYHAGICALILMLLLLLSAVWIRRGLTEKKNPKAAAPRKTETATVPYSPPCAGDIGMGYSPDVPVYNETLQIYETHEGTDYLCPDKKVHAAADGRVVSIYDDERYGLTVILEHPSGAKTMYASLESALVKKGQSVLKGHVIARAGASARTEGYACPHVHFVYTEDGKSLPCPFASQADS